MARLTEGVAVVTGGGGLLGRGLATALAEAGLDVVAADLNLASAQATADDVAALGRRSLAVETNVADPEAVQALAERTWDAFGRVNVLCNNAGGGAVLKNCWELTLADWQKVLGANLMGVVHGVQTFLPRMIAQGPSQGLRHIVNTASMSGVGLASLRALNAPYVTAKFAVVGLSETLAPALAAEGIGVSVLCPGMTVADPSQPMEFRMPSAAWYKDNLLGSREVAQETLRGIEENRLHVFPHRASRREAEERHAAVMEGFAQAARTSPPERTPG